MTDLLFALAGSTVCAGLGLFTSWFLFKAFSDEPLLLTSKLAIYKKVNPSTHCVRCYHRFSDWFIWSTGRRYCYLCWVDSGYTIVIEETDHGT
jgi:hypothetical protein